MLRSLYSGVSGLINHQMKMDVLGNNIANINTVGYKGGRINFSESLNQTIATSSPGRGTGYINPMQVGLGMKTASIENIFAQGNLENTGVITDMAIEGEGFFMLKSNSGDFFTRAGQFFFNSDGKLVNQRGLAVQGWMVGEETNSVGFGRGNLSDMVIDPNLISEAIETENVWLSGNLNAGLETLAEIWEMGSEFTEAGVNATAATLLNNLEQVSTPLVAGDTIEITGVDSDGTSVSTTYTYAAGDTVQDLLNAVDTAYAGATATFTDGKIVLTDDVAGTSDTSINLSNGLANTGAITVSNFVNSTPGVTGTSRTSVIVYDSLGGSHNIIVDFTKTTTDGQWTWEATTSGDETIISGNTGSVYFDDAGIMTAFLFDGGVNQLSLDPGNGAQEMNINLSAETGDDYSGISQFESLSTLNVREQDGRSTGDLVSITVGYDGMISGSFSNGAIDNIAKVALGKFANYGGLSDLGDGVYQESLASGDVDVVGLEIGDPTAIVSGALEMSNVDLSKEFTEMITTQRGFQASSKVISTADQILDELIRLKR